MTLSDKTRSTITLSVTYAAANYAGTIYCAAFASGYVPPANGFRGQVITSGATDAFIVGDTASTITISGLKSVVDYDTYCVATNVAGSQSLRSDAIATYLQTTTACCKLLTFTKPPPFVYGDVTKYTPTTLPKFDFTLSSNPAADVQITPTVRDSIGNAVSTSVVTVHPASLTFTATGTLTGSFYLSASPALSGHYTVTLEASGTNAAAYQANVFTPVEILDSAAKVPAPVLQSAKFSNSGASIIVTFDSITDKAGIVANNFPCSQLLDFFGVNQTTCSFTSLSTVRIAFGVSTYGVPLLEVNGLISLKANKVKAACIAPADCTAYEFSPKQSTLVLTADNPVAPTVSIRTVGVASACDDFIIDPTGSSGHGGRSWKSVVWTATVQTLGAPVNDAAILQVLEDYGPITTSKISISKSLMSSANYVVTLTLTNMFGLSHTESAKWTVNDNPNLPLVSMVGNKIVDLVPSDTLSLAASARRSGCAVGSAALSYSWTISSDGNVLNIPSTDPNPLKFSLAGYSLSAETVYEVTFKATAAATTSPSYPSVFATGSVTVRVGKGAIVMVVPGGNSRTASVGLGDLILDASGSYDKTYPRNTAGQALTFAWSCMLTSLTNYGGSCGTALPASHNTARLTIAPATVIFGEFYEYTVTATAPDGRFNTYVVSVQNSAGSTSVAINNADLTKINPAKEIVLTGTLSAQYALDATWSATVDGVNFDFTALTKKTNTFTAKQVRSLLSFPLSVAANTFPAGSTVVFRLDASFAGDATRFPGHSTLPITVNSPPSGGSVSVDPVAGDALTDLFSLTAFSWTDDASDLPLSYKFDFRLVDSQTPKSVQGITLSNTASSPLPAGLDTQNNLVTVIATVYDIFESGASATATVTVNPVANFDLGSYVDTQLADALATGNTDQLTQIVSNAASTVNTVDCSDADKTLCDSLNRNLCFATAQRCSSCLEGYAGRAGDHNTMCHATGTVLGEIGATCSSNNDCQLDFCDNNLCAVPVLECPTVTTSECSGHGQCTYNNGNGRGYGRTCLITDTDCVAQCSCDDGFGGTSCSLSADDLIGRDRTRGALCRAVVSISNGNEMSAFLLDSLISALNGAFMPGEVTSADAKVVCYNAMTILGQFSADGYLSVASQNLVVEVTSKYVLDAALSTRGNGNGNNRMLQDAITNNSAVVDAVVSNIALGILNTMADGQEPVTFSNQQVNMIVYKSLAGNISTLAPDQDGTATYIELVGDELQDTLMSDTGYLESSAVIWVTNPFPGAEETESPSMRWEIFTDYTGARRTQEIARNGSEPAFYLVMQFTEAKDFNFTLSLDEAILLGPTNYTIPQCTEYKDGAYEKCDGCWVDTYTNYNVTFGCPFSAVTDIATTSRRLQAGNTLLNQYAASLTTVDPLASSIFNPDSAINWGVAKIVLAFLSTLTFIIIVGFLFFVHTDYIESHTIARYTTDGKQSTSKELSAPMFHSSSAVACAGSEKSSPSPMRPGSAKVEYDDVYENDSPKKFMHTADKEMYVSDVVTNFLNSVMPVESLQQTGAEATWTSFLTTMLKHHKYTAIFFGSSVKFPRTLRWASITMAFLLNLFFDTIFFGVFYPDDGTCQDRTGEDNCLASDSSATNTNLCVWHIDQATGQGFCGLNHPPRRFVYIITVVIVIVVISVPFQVAYDYLLYNFCVRRPRFEEWGYAAASEPAGAANAENKTSSIQALYERRTAVRAAPARVQYILDEDNFTAEQVYDTQLSTDDEARQILQESKVYLDHHVNSPQLTWQDAKFNSGKQAKANAIQLQIGIHADGSPVPLTFTERLVHGNPKQKLAAQISQARAGAAAIEKRLQTCSEVQAKDTLLIQHFILEQFTPAKQFVLRNHMFNSNASTQMSVTPAAWLLSWGWILLSMAFFLAWAFAWAATERGDTAAAWGIVLGTALAQDVLIIQVFRAYIIYSLSMVSIRPQLQYIYRVLNKVAISFAQDDITDNFLDVRVCQHLSPACRAAHSQAAHNLATASILRHIDDVDVAMCRSKTEISLTTLAALVLAVPVAFAIISETLGTIILDAMLPAFFDAVLIMNRYFWSGAGFFIILPFGLFIVAYWWYTRVHTPAYQKFAAQRRTVGTDKAVKRWKVAGRGCGKGFFLSMSENCMSFAYYITRPSLVLQAASDAWFGVYDPVYDAQWSAMNRPTYMQAFISKTPITPNVFARADRLAEKESDAAMQEILKRRIPEEISELLVATKVDWLEAWTQEPYGVPGPVHSSATTNDTRYVISMMSYRLNHVHRPAPAASVPSVVSHDGVVRSPRTTEFAERHSALGTSEEAVAHILRNYRKHVLMGRMSLVDGEESNELFNKESDACDVLIEFVDLRILLEDALSVFQPLGQALSYEEKDEIVESCYAWLVQNGDAFLEAHYNNDTTRIAAATLARINHTAEAEEGKTQVTNFSVPFQQFRRWFLSTGSAVVRYREQQQQDELLLEV